MNNLIIDKRKYIANIQAGQITNPAIEFGCGSAKKNKNSIGIDLIDSDCVDIVGDAYNILLVLPENSIMEIYASHFIEHVSDLKMLLSYFVRVLKPAGTIELIVPHFANPFFYSDPTHKLFFGLYTMSYFAIDNLLSRKVPNYSKIDGLVLVSVTLRFRSFRPRYLRHFLLKIVGFLFNLNYWTRELYEEIFSNFIPCYEVVYTLTKHSNIQTYK